MDAAKPGAEAVAVMGNRIVAVGTNAEIRALANVRTQKKFQRSKNKHQNTSRISKGDINKMKKFLGLMILGLASAGISAAQTQPKIDEPKPPVTQEQVDMAKKKPSPDDKTSKFDADGKIKRGAAIGAAKKVSLAEAMKNPGKYSSKPILVEGVIIRSCKMEGCWLELAPSKDASAVRIKMKDHAFFVPLDAAGLKAKVEGVMSVKTLSKAEVDHLMNEDGAKFSKINPDGTVTEISFEATGVELTKK